MRRREFMTLVGGAAAAWPLTAFGKVQRIAIVLPSFPVSKINETGGDPLFQGLFSELRRLGYVEGQSLLIERYSGEGRALDYADLARDVVSRNPDVIVSIGTNELTLDSLDTSPSITDGGEQPQAASSVVIKLTKSGRVRRQRNPRIEDW